MTRRRQSWPSRASSVSEACERTASVTSLGRWLTAALITAAGSSSFGQTPSFSLEAQQRLLGGSGSAAAETLARRQQLVSEGESRLAAGDAEGALRAFESAASIVHAADVELGLVRTYMQAGEYRKALTFGAHAAGAHRELPGGMALYTWLLHAGGQRAFAQRMLDEWLVRVPNDPVLLQARRELSGLSPRAEGLLAIPPIRIAPNDGSGRVVTSASVAGSAVLLPNGRQVVTSARAVEGARRVWVRNGLGRTAEGRLIRRIENVALLFELDTPLDEPTGWQAPSAAPPAGSPSYLVEFALSDDAAPAWPILHAGFFGRQRSAESARPLGIDAPPGPHGGPVFDRYGRVAGIAVSAPDGSNVLLPIESFLSLPSASDSQSSVAPMALDALYEAALRVSLQIIVER